jgi:hypothetical protein
MHADHLLGVIGLMRTMALQGRIERLRLWGPRGSNRVLNRESLVSGARRFPSRSELELDSVWRTGTRSQRSPSSTADRRRSGTRCRGGPPGRFNDPRARAGNSGRPRGGRSTAERPAWGTMAWLIDHRCRRAAWAGPLVVVTQTISPLRRDDRAPRHPSLRSDVWRLGRRARDRDDIDGA